MERKEPKQVLVGYVTLDREIEMENLSFQYAASFERLKVAPGAYPIYVYEDELNKRGNGKYVDCAYVYFPGIVVAGNVGGKPGDYTRYVPYIRGYSLAEYFFEGHDSAYTRRYDLRPEWELRLDDFISLDGKRTFMLGVYLKDGAELTYMK